MVDPILRASEVPSEAMDVVLSLAHSWGSIIYYPEIGYLGELIILDPAWLAAALKTVVTVRKDSGIEHGVVTFQHLKDGLWKAYSPLVRSQLLQLMQDFELIFPLKPLKACLVPCLLDKSSVPPPKVPQLQAPAAGGMRLCRLFIFPLLPANLFPRFLVRTYRYTLRGRNELQARLHGCSRQECWLVQNEQYGHVRVAESLTNTSTTLSINVWGSSPSNFFSILCDSVETLLREPFYERLRPQVRRKVPCPHCLLVDEKDAVLFDVAALEGRLEKGRSKIECPTCAEELDVLQLLNVRVSTDSPVLGFSLPFLCFSTLTDDDAQVSSSLSKSDLHEATQLMERNIIRQIESLGLLVMVL